MAPAEPSVSAMSIDNSGSYDGDAPGGVRREGALSQ